MKLIKKSTHYTFSDNVYTWDVIIVNDRYIIKKNDYLVHEGICKAVSTSKAISIVEKYKKEKKIM